MSLIAMAFLWTGSQIPVYIFGGVPPLIYADIGGADRWIWFVRQTQSRGSLERDMLIGFLGPSEPPRPSFDMPVCRVAVRSHGPEICCFDWSYTDRRGNDHLLNGPQHERLHRYAGISKPSY